MVKNGFDNSDLKLFITKTMRLANEVYPRETRNFMGRAGTKLKSRIKGKLKSTVKKKTGNLYRSIVRNRPYMDKTDNSYQVRVKAKLPQGAHGFLIEHGHQVYSHGKPTDYSAEGKHFMGSSYMEFEDEFFRMCDTYLDELLGKGL